MRALLVLMLFVLAGCGDNDNSAPRGDRIFVDGRIISGDECPLGATEAYRTDGLIVCDVCDDGNVCPNGQSCTITCGPACEDDTDGCCPVRVCGAF